MNLLEKLKRKWWTHETLHQLKDTLMRYGMDLTTPLSRIDKDYSRWEYCEFNYAGIIRFKYRSHYDHSRATQAMSAQAKDIKILENLFIDWTDNRDDDKATTIIAQERDFINFCGTCLLNAGYVSMNEKGPELKGDWTLQEIMQHRACELNYIWTNATFNNEVKNAIDVNWEIIKVKKANDVNLEIDDMFLLRHHQTVLVRDACDCYYHRDRFTTLKVKGHLILNKSFTPKMLFKGLHGKTTSPEFNVKKFCFVAGLRSSIAWEAYTIGLDDNKELVWEMFLVRNKFGKSTFKGILCSFILKNSELKDFIKHVVDGQMKDLMSAVREVRKVQVKQTASKWKC